MKITVGVSGTSGGFRKFIRNEIDIADASRKMNELEMEECKKNKHENLYQLGGRFESYLFILVHRINDPSEGGGKNIPHNQTIVKL